MTVFYIALAATGYAKLGTSFDLTKPLTSVRCPGARGTSLLPALVLWVSANQRWRAAHRSLPCAALQVRPACAAQVLPQDGWVVLMNLALFVRCIVAYILNANVWTGERCPGR